MQFSKATAFRLRQLVGAMEEKGVSTPDPFHIVIGNCAPNPALNEIQVDRSKPEPALIRRMGSLNCLPNLALVAKFGPVPAETQKSLVASQAALLQRRL